MKTSQNLAFFFLVFFLFSCAKESPDAVALSPQKKAVEWADRNQENTPCGRTASPRLHFRDLTTVVGVWQLDSAEITVKDLFSNTQTLGLERAKDKMVYTLYNDGKGEQTWYDSESERHFTIPLAYGISRGNHLWVKLKMGGRNDYSYTVSCEHMVWIQERQTDSQTVDVSKYFFTRLPFEK